MSRKTILITGGAGGIGSAISMKFAENDYDVIVTYNSNKEKAEYLIAKLKPGNHSVHHAPNTDSIAIDTLKSFVKARYGYLNVLVNNAGITTPVAHDDLDALTDEWIDRIMITNFRGSFAMIRAMEGLLRNEEYGFGNPNSTFAIPQSLVVNISSIAAITGIGSNVAYCASKAALDSMTRSLARALAPKIRVVSVSPGWVLGDYTKNIDPSYLQTQLDKTPLKRLATASDVANTVYALTDSLTFCTGNIIQVDGGRPLL